MMGTTIEMAMKAARRTGLRYIRIAYSAPKAIDAMRKRRPAQAWAMKNVPSAISITYPST